MQWVLRRVKFFCNNSNLVKHKLDKNSNTLWVKLYICHPNLEININLFFTIFFLFYLTHEYF